MLAGRAGVGTPHVSDLERRKVDPRLSTLLDVARALDLELMLVPKAFVPAVRALAARGHEEEERYLLNPSEQD